MEVLAAGEAVLHAATTQAVSRILLPPAVAEMRSTLLTETSGGTTTARGIKPVKKILPFLGILYWCFSAFAQGPTYHGNFRGLDLGLTNNPPFFGSNTFFVSYSQGNDATAQPGQANFAFQTFSNAWAAAFNIVSNPVFYLSPETHFVTTSSNSTTIFPILNNYFPTIVGPGATLLFTNT